MNNFWQDCLTQIKAMKLPPMIYSTWLEPLVPLRWDSVNGELLLGVPGSKMQTIRQTYQKTIQDIATHLYGSPAKVTLQPIGPSINL